MLLGSRDYNSSDNSDPDFTKFKQSKDNRQKFKSTAEELKEEAGLMNKLERTAHKEREREREREL